MPEAVGISDFPKVCVAGFSIQKSDRKFRFFRRLFYGSFRKKMIVLIAAISVVVIGLLVFIIKAAAAPKKVDSVRRLLKQGKNQAAAKVAKQIIAKDPNNYLAHYYLGKAYLADNRGELALIEYKTVNEHALFDAVLQEVPFRREFAALLVKFDHQEEAMREYLLLTKQEPTNADNFFNAGRLSEQVGRKDLALGFYKKCLMLNPKNAKAHASMGYILFQSKQFTEAKQELNVAISLNPEEYSCYYFLGKILKESKDIAGAVKAFDKAQRDSEYKQKALIERSTCYMIANRIDNAQIDLQRAIELDKDGTKNDTLYARYFLAACYEKNRKIEKAIEQWQIIYSKNHSFRDVASKLSEYKDLQANDSLKDYLTCSDAEFIEICKNLCLKALNLSAQKADSVRDGCSILAVEAKEDDWRNMRKQAQYLRFYRAIEPVEDTAVREVLDKAKAANCTKSYVIASSGFTRTAIAFAENRPVELIEKQRLETLLTTSSS